MASFIVLPLVSYSQVLVPPPASFINKIKTSPSPAAVQVTKTLSQLARRTTTRVATPNTSRTTNNKIVMINFDDAWESQYLYAKPILDKYGFKASFFILCAHVSVPGHDPPYMTWPEVANLTKDTMDIESHTMTHAHLTELNDAAQLNYEIVTAKDCFTQHGITTNWFGYPLNLGQDNKIIVSVVASV
jgi:peptidoglycan/xylan/chitin deacetylase (PgdA/CDA1 family)